MSRQMNYVSGILQPRERVVAIGRLHWIIYRKAAIFLIVAIACVSVMLLPLAVDRVPFFGLAALFFLALALWYAIAAWFERWTTEIAVTNFRVIYKQGFVRRRTAEMNMDKVETVEVTQSILGRLLGYGSVQILGTGQGIEHLHKITDPVSLRNCIIAR
jgi:membrane protein YdbS with pleckstrin-like domain